MRQDLIKGIVLVEGSFPLDHLNPAIKHVVHFGRETMSKGLLDWFSMFCFERNNKRVKKLVKHTSQPITSLANNIESDITTRIEILSQKEPSDFQGMQPECFTGKIAGYDLSQRERHDMEAWGTNSFRDVKAFRTAKVLGVHFRSGEWGQRRCGSVITTIYQDISRYCIVNAFLMVEDKTYVSVTWLSTPMYPYSPFKIVVKVKLMTDVEQMLHPSVIPVDRIQPTTVAVMPDSDNVHFWMMREKGIDR